MNYALEHGYSVERGGQPDRRADRQPQDRHLPAGRPGRAGCDGRMLPTTCTRRCRRTRAAKHFSCPSRSRLMARGRLGNKSGAGFYKQDKAGAGKRVLAAESPDACEHEAPTKNPRFESGRARHGRSRICGERLRFDLRHGRGDRAGEYLMRHHVAERWPIPRGASPRSATASPTWTTRCAGASRRSSARSRPGTRWACGATVEMMRQRGIDVAPWVEQMLERGIKSFYRRAEKRVTGVYDQQRAGLCSGRAAGRCDRAARPARHGRELAPQRRRQHPGSGRRRAVPGVPLQGQRARPADHRARLRRAGAARAPRMERAGRSAIRGRIFASASTSALLAMAIGRAVRHDRACSQAAAGAADGVSLRAQADGGRAVRPGAWRRCGGGAAWQRKPSRRPKPIWAWSSSASA